MMWRSRTAAVFVLSLLSACTLLARSDGPRVHSPELDELSGLAVSHADPALIWGHNDSGDRPRLFRMGVHGEDLGMLAIEGAVAVDWEDIAAFDWQGAPALLIADVGDNNAVRDHVTLYAVRDPGREGASAPLLWKIDFRYPDGARDCEAVAVDPVDRSVLLLSKREYPQHLYRIPLPDDGAVPPGVSVAELLNPNVRGIPPASLAEMLESPVFGRFLGMPTAMDIARDGRFAVVVTYRHAYRFWRAQHQSWAEVFAQKPETIPLTALRQTEAGAIDADGRTLIYGSEGRHTPLLSAPLPPVH